MKVSENVCWEVRSCCDESAPAARAGGACERRAAGGRLAGRAAARRAHPRLHPAPETLLDMWVSATSIGTATDLLCWSKKVCWNKAEHMFKESQRK